MAMKRFMLSITEEMGKALEKERKKRMLGTIPETARVILGNHCVFGSRLRALQEALHIQE